MATRIIEIAVCSSSSARSQIRDILDVFCLEDDGQLHWLRSQGNTWTQRHLKGLPIAGNLRAAAIDASTVDVFGTGSDGRVIHWTKTPITDWVQDVLPWGGSGPVAPVWWYGGTGDSLQINAFRLQDGYLDSWSKRLSEVFLPWTGPAPLANYIVSSLTAFNLSDLRGTAFSVIGLDPSGHIAEMQYYAGIQWRRDYPGYAFAIGARRLIACVLSSASDGYNHTNVFELKDNSQLFHHFRGHNGWQLKTYTLPFPAEAQGKSWTLMDCCDRSQLEVDLLFLSDQNEVAHASLFFPFGLENATLPTIACSLVTRQLMPFDKLSTFSHVVVLMLENRSFDNLLGYLYADGVPQDAPVGKTFEGIAAAESRLGKPLSNPFPPGSPNPPPAGTDNLIRVAPVDEGNYFQPYPDPGEEYPHINTQLFNTIDGGAKAPYNVPSQLPTPAPMTGFVKDYIENYKAEMYPGKDPTYDDYKQIMQCYKPEAVPVLSTLAKEFAVFDHWFCSVPSQTWCNRAFFNAGTSGGRVINGPSGWALAGAAPTIFNLIQSSPLDWRVYSDQPYASLTGIIHLEALVAYHLPPLNKFSSLTPNFFDDCAQGKLPAYSFLEPRFWTPHNDMHPSTPGDEHYDKGKVGSVLLGEALVQQVYDAIRRSNTQTAGANNSQNTLLIITFDEHGGCYDHVDPPRGVTPPDLSGFDVEDGFDFTRLGIRVPMIMVSAHIARHTIVNTTMYHDSFLKTVSQKWNALFPGKFGYLTKRVETAPDFSEVFTLETPRPASDWPVIPAPTIPPEFFARDFSGAPLSALDRSILEAIVERHPTRPVEARALVGGSLDNIRTVGQAVAMLEKLGVEK